MLLDQKLGLDKIPGLNIHYCHLPKLHGCGVGHVELRPESMVGLDTWADHHLILRPVVNTGHRNWGDSQVAGMNLGFVNHLVGKQCLG